MKGLGESLDTALRFWRASKDNHTSRLRTLLLSGAASDVLRMLVHGSARVASVNPLIIDMVIAHTAPNFAALALQLALDVFVPELGLTADVAMYVSLQDAADDVARGAQPTLLAANRNRRSTPTGGKPSTDPKAKHPSTASGDQSERC